MNNIFDRVKELEDKLLETQKEIEDLKKSIKQDEVLGYYRFVAPWISSEISYFWFNKFEAGYRVSGVTFRSFKRDKGIQTLININQAVTHVDRLNEMEKITEKEFKQALIAMDRVLLKNIFEVLGLDTEDKSFD